MTSPEESRDDSQVIDAELEIVSGGIRPENSLQKQFNLTEKLFEREKSRMIDGLNMDELMKTREGRNEVMAFWSNSGYSEAYREILQNQSFSSHPRLRGDFLNITLEDLDYYGKHKKLLE